MLIDARLRHERGWSDARILNISRRGLMARAAKAPRPGSYVEMCRGSHRIIARVVWVDGGRFGARSQDMIAVDAIARGEEAPAASAAIAANDRRLGDRDRSSLERAERGRRWSRRLEFIAVLFIGCAAAFLLFDSVLETLARPLTVVEARLGAG